MIVTDNLEEDTTDARATNITQNNFIATERLQKLFKIKLNLYYPKIEWNQDLYNFEKTVYILDTVHSLRPFSAFELHLALGWKIL